MRLLIQDALAPGIDEPTVSLPVPVHAHDDPGLVGFVLDLVRWPCVLTRKLPEGLADLGSRHGDRGVVCAELLPNGLGHSTALLPASLAIRVEVLQVVELVPH